MKAINLLLVGIVLLLFAGCNDDDDDKLSENALYQTQWSGVLQFRENGKNKECNVTILFETLTHGRYISDNLDKDSWYSDHTPIDYEINNKIISIYGGFRNVVAGDWWIEKNKKGKLVLKREPYTEYEATLTLNKL